MRKLMTGLVAVGLVLVGFIARDLMLLSSANAAVAGLDHIGLRMDLDFRRAVEWIIENCEADEFGFGYRIDC